MKARSNLIRASVASFAALGAIGIFLVSCGKESKGKGGGGAGPQPSSAPYSPTSNPIGGYYPPQGNGSNGSIIDLPQGTDPRQVLLGDWVAAQATASGTDASISFRSGNEFSATNFDKSNSNQGWNSTQALTGTFSASLQQNIIVIDLKTAGNGQGGYNPYDPYNPGQPGNPYNPGQPVDPYNPGQPGYPYPGQPGNPNFPGNIAKTINCIATRIGAQGGQAGSAGYSTTGREALAIRCNFETAGYPQSFDEKTIVLLRSTSNQPIYR